VTDRQAPRPPHARCHAVIATARRGGARFSITDRMDAAVKKAIAASAWTPIRYPRSARRLRMHLPRDWPWEHAWTQLFDATCGPPAAV
jgi:hypothetical protein